MDWKLELIMLPVADVDRAKAFYTEKAGFVVDHDVPVDDDVRFVQLAPPSSINGRQMAVPDIQAAHDEPAGKGMDISEVAVLAWGSFVYFSDPDGNSWAVQELPARGG